MKTLVIILMLVCTNVYACIYEAEAQFVGEIEEVETDSNTYCRGIVDPSKVSFFRENMFCPLDLGEIVEQGIEMPLKNGHDCEVPGQVGGILVLQDGKIFFE